MIGILTMQKSSFFCLKKVKESITVVPKPKLKIKSEKKAVKY